MSTPAPTPGTARAVAARRASAVAAAGAARALSLALPLTLATGLALAPGPAQAKDLSCGFRVRGPLELSFGELDPSAPRTVVQRASGPAGSLEVGDCHHTVTLTVRLLHARGVLTHTDGVSTLPYSLAIEPAQLAGPGNFAHAAIRIVGTIAPEAYRNARPGVYTEKNITVDVTP